MSVGGNLWLTGRNGEFLGKGEDLDIISLFLRDGSVAAPALSLASLTYLGTRGFPEANMGEFC